MGTQRNNITKSKDVRLQILTAMIPPLDSDSDFSDLTAYGTFNNPCCVNCARAIEYTANLSMSTAFSNRFLQELSQKDPAMDEISTALKKLSHGQHNLAVKMINHIISNGWRFKHQDPLKPSWIGEPSDIVLNGNRDLVESLRDLLEKLKSHQHVKERNLIKGYLKKSKLPQLWDQLDRLLVSKLQNSITDNTLHSTFAASLGASDISNEDEKIEVDEYQAPENGDKTSKDEKLIDVTKNVKESPIEEVFQYEKSEEHTSSEEKILPEVPNISDKIFKGDYTTWYLSMHGLD